jgi:hypothetical protein
MKRVSILALVVVALLLPGVVGAAKTPWEVKLPFKAATINYEISGMESGQEILYIRQHGKETARYRSTTTSMLGMSLKNQTVEIMTPDWVYSFDLQEGTGSKSINPEKLMIEEYNKLSSSEKKKVQENGEKMGASAMSGMQGSVQENAKEILGYSCDRATIMGTTVYSIHGTPIALLLESNMMGVSMKSVATAVDKWSVADRHFAFPAGIEPQPDPEADQVARMMAQQTIEMLKDPEAYKKENKGMMGVPPGQQQDIPEEDQKQMEEAMKALKGLFGD